MNVRSLVFDDEPQVKPAPTKERPRRALNPDTQVSREKSFGHMACRQIMQAKQILGTGFPTDDPVAGRVDTSAGNILAPDWSNEIFGFAPEWALLPLCWVNNTTAYSMDIMVDNKVAWEAAKGVTTTWIVEGKQIAQSKPITAKTNLKMLKLAALVPVTEELTEDLKPDSMQSYLMARVRHAIHHEINRVILYGSGGTAEPTGFFGTALQVDVTAAGITTPELFSIYARNINPEEGTWIVHPQVAGEFLAAAQHVISHDANGRIRVIDRPVIITQSLGTADTNALGGIVYADLSAYAVAMRAMDSAVSVHLWFDYHTNAFRFTVRMNGFPVQTGGKTPEVATTAQNRAAFIRTKTA